MNTNVTKNSMRGLSVFISDIRNAQSKEGEEKRVQKEMAHIRKEFKENKGIDGYQRRKYVCKLLYIYMLGYDLDFGHMEAVTLTSSNKYQEKSIGYIALGMLLHENHEIVPLLINSLQEDLQARSDFFQCLALAAICNIGGKEMAESLAPLIQKLLVATTTPPMIKKRCALALLRLYRKYPTLITPDLWADKLVHTLEDHDMGVLTATLSLLLGLVADQPEGWHTCVPKVVALLARVVITREYTKDYVYYSIPNPWLQVKALRFLRYFPPPTDSSTSTRLTEILNVIFASADSAKAGTVNHKNALNAVLFEAISLVVHQDVDQGLLRQTGALLGRFITAKETNIRYLALEAMSLLATLSTETANMVKKYQETVILSLKDADISIRRRALDLLYGMCDKSTSKTIVAELLNYLVTADYAIREELVLKIANLAEKFASNYAWYVDVILQLISLAGDFVSDDIWHRVIKIVTNHEDIQEYAATTVFKALQSPTCHETTVKVGGYILGEFGHLIAEQRDSSPQAQFQILHTRFITSSLQTRALLLSAYAKFINLYPEIVKEVQEVFNQYRSFIDTEIQQRACEYFNLSMLNNEELLSTVLDVIPAWTEKEDASSNQQREGTPTGHLVDDDQRSRRRDVASPSPQKGDDLLGLDFTVGANSAAPSGTGSGYGSNPVGGYNAGSQGQGGAAQYGSAGAGGYAQPGSGANSLLGGFSDPLAMGAATRGAATDQSNAFGGSAIGVTSGTGSQGTAGLMGGMGSTASSSYTSQPTAVGIQSGVSANQGTLLSAGSNNAFTSFGGSATAVAGGAAGGTTTDTDPKVGAAYRRLCLVNEGVLYEDGSLQIGLKSEYRNEMGRIMLYYGNSSMTAFTNFRAVVNPVPTVNLTVQPIADVIESKAQVAQQITLTCSGEFVDPPTLNISYTTPSKPVNISLKLPIVATKFIDVLKLSAPDFFNQWKVHTGKPFEEQSVFKSSKSTDIPWLTKVINDGLKLNVLKGVDPSINNIVAAGTFISSGGQVAALIRLETNPQSSMCRLTVRSPSGTLSTAISSLLNQHLTVA